MIQVSYDDGVTFVVPEDTPALVTDILINDMEIGTEIQTYEELEVLQAAVNEVNPDLLPIYVDAVNDGLIFWHDPSPLDALYGPFNSAADFAEELAHDLGYMEEVPNFILGSIDWKGVWESSLRHDYYELWSGYEYYYLHVGDAA